MKQETKSCQSCKTDFVIEPEDFAFYEKIGVPSPTWCPECRARLRLSFRNERVFYKRKCDKCNREIVSMYSENKPYTVWCYDCWFSEDWDATEYAQEYDEERPFFDQFKELWERTPKVALIYVRSPGSEYTNISADNKNCYMIVESSNNESCIHCYWIQQSKDLVDVSFSHKTELSYESDDCYNSYRLFYSKGCHDSRDSYFLLDCQNCSDCIGCVNLRNKKYHVFNEPYSKDEYSKFLREAKFHSHSGVEKFRKKFNEFSKTQPKKYSEIVNAPNCTGNYIKNAKNCHSVFHCYDAEDCKYGVHVWRNAKDCMDCDTAGRGAELIYNSINSGINTAKQISCSLCWSSTHIYNSQYCFDSDYCFGCVGLRKKKYCILNKQYNKETYNTIREQIVSDMKSRNEWGQFFPPAISAFGYNESAAQEQFPLEQKDALNLGFKWENTTRGTYGKSMLLWDKVPDSIHDVPDSLAKEIFQCVQCEKNYIITPDEFMFYKKTDTPLPRLCPDCRHARRFQARGPNKLFSQRCDCDFKTFKNTEVHSHHKTGRCPNEFETSYSSDRPEIVYCEQCYNAEVA